MSNWINNATELEGELVHLVPLKRKHFEALLQLAKDNRIWAHYTLDGSNSERLRLALADAMLEQEKGAQFPFVIIEKSTNRIIGSTRFLELQAAHLKLEIG